MTRSTPNRRLLTLAAGSALAMVIGGGAMTSMAAPGGPPDKNPSTDGSSASGRDSSSAIVQLSAAPLSLGSAGVGQLDLTSAKAADERATLAAQRKVLRGWLKTNAPKARVSGEYDIAVNAVAVRLNGTSLDTLRSAPGVVSADYQALYTPLAHDDPDLSLINAQAGWTASGQENNAGTGVQVAIVDTGIDVTHPCFDDAGYPDTVELGDTRFTNDKVIVAKVFNNKAAQQNLTPEALQDHGTHVAGTVACNAHTPAVVEGVDIPYDPSGVAPGAQLGNYNVFPGDVDSARSEDILNALQAAAADGMDVINMSLGGGARGVQDLLTKAVNNLDEAGIVVAVAAGNSGPGHFTVESPGSAERALTAGASTVGHFVGLPVTGPEVSTTAATGDFGTPDTDLTAVLDAAAGDPLGLGCSAGDFADFTDGAIALISRGTCTFGTKVFNAEQAGAVAAIIVNNVPGDPIAMAADPLFPTTIPAVMVGLDDLDAMLAAVGQPVTIGAQAQYEVTGNDNIMAAFSGQGPTDVDFRVKPDVVAPGVNVLSSIPHQFCDDPGTTGCWAFFQGTSMATPHLAGMAAVVRQTHPDWQAWQVRSAIVNTAQQGALTKASAITEPETDVQVIGAGLADLGAAVNAQVALSPVSTSFGAVPSKAGQTLTRQITLTNLTGSALNLPVSVAGTSFTVTPTSVALGPNETQTLTVTFTVGKRAVKGDQQATLDVGGVAHSVLSALVK